MLQSRVTAGLTQFPEYNGAIRATFAALLWGGLALFARLGVELRFVRAAERWPALTRRILAIYCLGVGVAASYVAHDVFAPVHAPGLASLNTFGALLLFAMAVRLLLPLSPPVSVRHGVTALCLLAIGAFVPTSSLAVFAVHSRAYGVSGLLRSAKWVLDFDRDRTAPWWVGGTDCAPLSAAISPAARDIPGDSVDQDCSGADAPATAAKPARDDWPQDCPLPERPNILLLTIDTMRSDAVSARATPALWAAQKSALTFERAYAPATLTRHSLPALFSGRWPSDLSEGTLLTHRDLRVVEPIAERLTAAGYSAIAMHTLEPEIPYLGFANVLPAGVMWPSAGHFNEAAVSRELTRTAESLLTRPPSTPMFLWVHYLQPHAPYEHHVLAGDHLVSDYEREVADVDLQIDRLLRAVEHSEHAAQTVVIVTSDHGESLRASGHEGHGPDAIEAVMRVPLFMIIPGCKARSYPNAVSSVHLAATMELMATGHTASPTIFDRSQIVLVEAASRGLRRAVILDDDKLVIDVPTGSRWLARTADESLAPSNAAVRLQQLNTTYQRWLDRPLRPISTQQQPRESASKVEQIGSVEEAHRCSPITPCAREGTE